MNSELFLKRISLDKELPSDSYLSLLPVVKNLKKCKGLTFDSPVTFFVGENGEVLFNEINTMPGMTDASIFPAALAYLGHPIADWLPRLAESARSEAL